VTQGIADPKKLGIVGWSYGGYAALQSAVLDADLFKAIVASGAGHRSGHALKREIFGNFDNGRCLYRQAARMSAKDRRRRMRTHQGARPAVPWRPDANVDYPSRGVMARLKAAGGKVELDDLHGLDHQLDDGYARTEDAR
jgi:pimeloyl-ACP methyl ester carboxylesterase